MEWKFNGRLIRMPHPLAPLKGGFVGWDAVGSFGFDFKWHRCKP